MRSRPLKNPVFSKDSVSGFTLVEVVVSMILLALLAGSVYEIVTSCMGASQTTMTQQFRLRRLDAFLRVTREAFLNLPAEGSVRLEIGHAQGGQAEQDLIIDKPQAIFGLPSLAGGSLVLAARPNADGTRTMTLLKIPANATDRQRAEALSATGIPLLPRLIKPRWTFKDTPDSDWKEEYPSGSPRPLLVRLQMEINDLPEPVESVFFVPPLTPVVTTNAPGTNTNPAAGPAQIP